MLDYTDAQTKFFFLFHFVLQYKSLIPIKSNLSCIADAGAGSISAA